MTIIAYANPYSNQTFLGFFVTLISRLLGLLSGDDLSLATDEVQVLVLGAIAVSGGLIGTFLVLRQMAMLANSLSHTILVGIVFAYYLMLKDGAAMHGPLPLSALLVASLVMGLLTTFLTQGMSQLFRLQADASTGLVFSSLFALGIVLVTLLLRSAHIGSEVVMGNADGLTSADIPAVYVVLALNVISLLLFFKEFKITSFDPGLARSVGISVPFFTYLLMTQVSLTTVAAFRAVGVLMLLAFLTGPPLTARFLTHRLKVQIALSCLLGLIAALIGVALSRHLYSVYDLAVSTGGLVVCVITFQFVFVATLTFTRGMLYFKGSPVEVK